MKMIQKNVDLFKTNYPVYVHCISLDCAMGKGIAKQFSTRFPSMKSHLLHRIKLENINYPTALEYITPNEIVINMITKERYYNKPTYTSFKLALEEVVNIVNKYNIKQIAMPKIGCGLDRLSWSRVQDMIKEAFKDTDVEILICIL